MLSCFLSKKRQNLVKGRLNAISLLLLHFASTGFSILTWQSILHRVDVYLNHITFLYKSMSNKTLSYRLFFHNMYFYFGTEQ